jgi:hypothetical protein
MAQRRGRWYFGPIRRFRGLPPDIRLQDGVAVIQNALRNRVRPARRALAVAAIAALAGCSSTQESIESFFDGFDVSDWGMAFDTRECAETRERVLDGVDFSDAKVIDVRIRNEEFTPMIVELTRNRPYILRVSNRDDEARRFAAPDFLKDTAISAVALDNELLEEPCRSVFKLDRKQTLEIQLYTLDDGHYEFYDSSNILPYYVPSGAAGIINVELPPS